MLNKSIQDMEFIVILSVCFCVDTDLPLDALGQKASRLVVLLPAIHPSCLVISPEQKYLEKQMC